MANRLKPALTFLRPSLAHFGPAVVATAVLMSLAACSGSKWHEVDAAPNTGDPIAEKEVAPPAPELHRGETGYVAPTHLPARSSADQPAQQAPDHLERNDRVRVTDPNPSADPSSVEAVVTSSGQPHMVGKKVYLKKAYIAEKPVVPTNEQNDADKYFVIQNIATEKLRVYRACASKDADGGCINKLVFETEMTAGEDTPDRSRRTILGSYRVESWHKFYEDRSHYFPAFYDPTYPAEPQKGTNASMQEWMNAKYLPKKGGAMRGSFGWYTAYLTPNASNQWTHGTFGWGEDGTKFILAMKDGAGVDERSQGCTRVENQAIALMREILPAGSRMVKIYAREDLADRSLARYRTSGGHATWNWVLTKKRGADAPKSGAKWATNVGSDEVLDSGAYKLDQHPDVASGDLYKVGSANMHGVFLIDAGTLVGYEHPAGLKVGGESGLNSLPSVVLSKHASTRAPVKPVAAPVKPATDAKPAAQEPNAQLPSIKAPVKSVAPPAKPEPAKPTAAAPAATAAQPKAPANLNEAAPEL